MDKLEQTSAETNPDIYAKGMSHYNESHYAATTEYDCYQYELIDRYLEGKILELGAGAGRITTLAAAAHPDATIYASEPSPNFFAQLTRRCQSRSNITLTTETLEELCASRFESFDTVFHVHVLEHIENDQDFVDSCLKLLRHGGQLVFEVPALNFLYAQLDRNIGHYRRYDKKMIRKLFSDRAVKFELLRYDNLIGVFAWLIFFKLLKIEYQSSNTQRSRFFFLAKVFSKYIVPLVKKLESKWPPPLGLNLTVVVKKLSAGQNKS